MGTVWTDAHERAALTFLFEDATRLVREATDDGRRQAEIVVHALYSVVSNRVGSEERFLAILSNRPDPVRILRRVCARAEGREVVETEVFYRVYDHDGDIAAITVSGGPKPSAARLGLRWPDRCRVVKVTLTRRRILKAKKGKD